MKKCASCSKDLPEAALHCVFCGAKQAPVPAVQPGLAKTAFGYGPSSGDMQQLRNQAAAYQPPRPNPPSQPPPAYQPPRPHPGSQPPPYGAPVAAANAATVMIGPGGAPLPQQQPYGQPGYAQPAAPPPTYNAGAMPAAGAPAGIGIHAPQVHTPQPLPPASPQPYLAAQTARADHPIEPWKDSLKIVMAVWGLITLGAFATPVSTDPMAFNWDMILHGEGTAKIPFLLIAAVGFLSVVIGLIPMISLPRGILAAALGLAGIFVPKALGSFGEWQQILQLIGVLTLVPGLLVRNEYTESLLARVLVTIGVVCTLVPYLVPAHGDIPLVGLFKGLIDSPGKAKVGPILELLYIVLVVLTLLAWMPGPATGGAKVFAWIIIMYPLVVQIVAVLLAGHIGDAITKAPFPTLMAWAPAATYVVLIGYGTATVLGKQLE